MSEKDTAPSDSATGKATLFPTDLTLETQKVLQTIKVLEMYRAQREVANELGSAYLRLAEHSEQANEVRLTAQSTRNQHLMVNKLMKRLTVTADQIVNNLIPVILDAVAELKSTDVVRETFGQVKKIAEEMKSEVEATQMRYFEIQMEVPKNMASVTMRNKEVFSEQEMIKIDIEHEILLAKAAKLAQKELDEEKMTIEQDLHKLMSKRDNLMEQAEMAREMKNKKADDAVFDFASQTPGMFFSGGDPLGIALTGVNFLTASFRSNERQKHFEQLNEANIESQNAVERDMDRKRNVIGRMHDQRMDALARLATLKKLAMQTANLGNVLSLREAHAQLGTVNTQFTTILEFWSNMAVALEVLQDGFTCGSVYLAKIENPKFVERFKICIERSKKGWEFFRRICSDYVQKSETQIYTLYNFLSESIDIMAAMEREKRQREVLLAIEADI